MTITHMSRNVPGSKCPALRRGTCLARGESDVGMQSAYALSLSFSETRAGTLYDRFMYIHGSYSGRTCVGHSDFGVRNFDSLSLVSRYEVPVTMTDRELHKYSSEVLRFSVDDTGIPSFLRREREELVLLGRGFRHTRVENRSGLRLHGEYPRRQPDSDRVSELKGLHRQCECWKNVPVA